MSKGGWGRDAVICGFLFTAAMAYFALSIRYVFDLQDEGYLSTLNSLAARGGMPHRDFTDVYGPGVYWLNGALHSAFGGQILAARVGVAAFKAAAVVLTYLLVRSVATVPFAILGGLFAIVFWGRPTWALTTPYASLYTIPLCMAACWSLMCALRRRAWLGFFAGGVIIGCAFLFKQSLAMLSFGGLGVAIWAGSLLEAEACRQRGARADLVWALGPLVAAGVAILVPFLSWLSLRDYLIHFAPFHLLLGVVAAAVFRHRPRVESWPIVKHRLAPFALGAVLVPGLVFVFYATRGALGTLLKDLFVLPMRLENYYVAVRTPPWEAAVFAIGLFCAISACLLAMRGRWSSSLVVLTPAVAALGLAVSLPFYTEAPLNASLVRLLQPKLFEEILGPAVVLAAVLALVPLALKQDPDRRVLPLLFLGSMLLFQGFPRASFRGWIVEAASIPVLTWALFRWREVGLVGGSVQMSRVLQRAIATLLTLVMPLWMSGHAVAGNAPIAQLGASRRTLDLPGTSGIALDPAKIRVLEIDPLESLVAHLGEAEPSDAPILLLGSAWMVVFLSGRPMLFPERSAPLFLMTLDMLPDAGIEDLDESAMLERLRQAPDVIIIDERGPISKRMRAALPELSSFVDREFRIEARFGPFGVLRRAKAI